MQIVGNASPILSFFRPERLDPLQAVTDFVVIPTGVYEEIVVPGAGTRGADEVEHAGWINAETSGIRRSPISYPISSIAENVRPLRSLEKLAGSCWLMS